MRTAWDFDPRLALALLDRRVWHSAPRSPAAPCCLQAAKHGGEALERGAVCHKAYPADTPGRVLSTDWPAATSRETAGSVVHSSQLPCAPCSLASPAGARAQAAGRGRGARRGGAAGGGARDRPGRAGAAARGGAAGHAWRHHRRRRRAAAVPGRVGARAAAAGARTPSSASLRGSVFDARPALSGSRRLPGPFPQGLLGAVRALSARRSCARCSSAAAPV